MLSWATGTPEGWGAALTAPTDAVPGGLSGNVPAGGVMVTVSVLETGW